MAKHNERTYASPATKKQKALIQILLNEQDVPPDLRREAAAPNLTDGDCRRIIPLLKELKNNKEDYGTTPEGYDDSPDQGVHRFDGGGFW